MHSDKKKINGTEKLNCNRNRFSITNNRRDWLIQKRGWNKLFSVDIAEKSDIYNNLKFLNKKNIKTHKPFLHALAEELPYCSIIDLSYDV